MEVKYEVLEMLGLGNFGKVYRGRRRGTGLTVAMKAVSKGGREDRDLNELRKEIGINANLNHPGIILMMETFETPKNFILVLEFAHGDLYQVLNDDGKLPEKQVQQIAKQLVSALHYLHSHRVIHRDMKPQNILITSSGRVKLCDFGFARSMSSGTLMVRSIKGTPLYMAPEVVMERPYNHVADLWSLGVILFELVMGRPPFHADDLIGLIRKIVKEPLVIPVDSGLSFQFRELLEGLLNKDPMQRLVWPDLLNHPFVVESKEERSERRQLTRDPERNPKLRMNRFLRGQNEQQDLNKNHILLEVFGILNVNSSSISEFKDFLIPYVLKEPPFATNEQWKQWESNIAGINRFDSNFQSEIIRLLAATVQKIDEERLHASTTSPQSINSKIQTMEANQKAKSDDSKIETLQSMQTNCVSALRILSHLANTKIEENSSKICDDIFSNAALLPTLIEYCNKVFNTSPNDTSLIQTSTKCLRLCFIEVSTLVLTKGYVFENNNNNNINTNIENSNGQVQSKSYFLSKNRGSFINLAKYVLELFIQRLTYRNDSSLSVTLQSLKGIIFIFGRMGTGCCSVTSSSLFETTVRLGLFNTLSLCLKPKASLNSRSSNEACEKVVKRSLHAIALIVHPVLHGSRTLCEDDEIESFPLSLKRTSIFESPTSKDDVSALTYEKIDKSHLDAKSLFLENRVHLEYTINRSLACALISENSLSLLLQLLVKRGSSSSSSATPNDSNNQTLRTIILRVLIHAGYGSNLIGDQVISFENGAAVDELLSLAKLPLHNSKLSALQQNQQANENEHIVNQNVQDEYASSLAFQCLRILVQGRHLSVHQIADCANASLKILSFSSILEQGTDLCIVFPAIGLLDVSMNELYLQSISNPVPGKQIQLKYLQDVLAQLKTNSSVLKGLEISLNFGSGSVSHEALLESCSRWFKGIGGSGLGVPQLGITDTGYALMQTIVKTSRYLRKRLSLSSASFSENKDSKDFIVTSAILPAELRSSIWVPLCWMQASSISPLGLISAIGLIQQEISRELSPATVLLEPINPKAVKTTRLSLLLSLLRESHVTRTLTWPKMYGGGPMGVSRMLSMLSKTLSMPLPITLNDGRANSDFVSGSILGVDSHTLKSYYNIMLKHSAIKRLLWSLVLSLESISENSTSITNSTLPIIAPLESLPRSASDPSKKTLIQPLSIAYSSSVSSNSSTSSSSLGSQNFVSINNPIPWDAAEFGIYKQNITIVLDIIYHLIRSSHHFALQFLNCGGINALSTRCKFLSCYQSASTSTMQQYTWIYPPPVVEMVLKIISATVKSITSVAGLFEREILLNFKGKEKNWGLLLCHSSPTIRARACSLFGLLCRQSPLFYSFMKTPFTFKSTSEQIHHTRKNSGAFVNVNHHLSTVSSVSQHSQTTYSANFSIVDEILMSQTSISVMDILIHCCVSLSFSNLINSYEVLQYSTFAIGNAAYYSDDLYPLLSKAIPSLGKILDINVDDVDGENLEKAWSNTAGAIGNLLRHSNVLFKKILDCGIHISLVNLLERELSKETKSMMLIKMGNFAFQNLLQHGSDNQELIALASKIKEMSQQ